MRKLHFLFSNGAKFSLEIPTGKTIRERVTMLSEFVGQNEKHVENHRSCYASGARVKFPTSRGFYVGYEDETGTIKTLITPESKAIKYRGKALLLETLASEIEYRVNALTNDVPFVGCRTDFTSQMLEAIEHEQSVKERKALKAANV